jgi:hypothetical protein
VRRRANALARDGIAYPCGLTFERWITPEEAADDLAMLARLN